MAKIIVLGSSNTDIILRADKLPAPGQTVLGHELLQAGGGKGANQAVAAARAGGRVVFIGAVGDDAFGIARRAELETEGINLNCLRVIPAKTSGVALIMVDTHGENLIGVAPGTNAEITPEDIDALPLPLLQKGDIFVSQLETPITSVHAALKKAKEAGVTTILNPAPPQAIIAQTAWLSLIDILILNEHELADVTGNKFTRADEALPLLKELHAAGAQSVIVTLGSEGYIISTPDGLRSFPAFHVDVVDTVAAGDTFVGALAARLAERNSLEASAEWAGGAAALAVTRQGAQPSIPKRSEVDAFLARYRNMPTASPRSSTP